MGPVALEHNSENIHNTAGKANAFSESKRM